MKRIYVPVFIEHGKRRMYLGGVTAYPTGTWTVQQARPFQDHDMRPRMVKGRSMLRLAQRVASVVSCRPARCRAPTARFLRVAMALGPERVRTVEWSSR